MLHRASEGASLCTMGRVIMVGSPVPIYMDTHEDTMDLPSELRARITERIRSGEKDAFGVVDRGIIIDREGRKVHCVLDAPDVDAVRRHHEDLNVPLRAETVHRADVILKG